MGAAMRVLVRHWIVGDGEMKPVELGDNVSLGLAIDLTGPLESADDPRSAGVAYAVTSDEVDDVIEGSRCKVIGQVRLVCGPTGVPLFVTLWTGETSILVPGQDLTASVEEGDLVTAHGYLVFEPYLWQPDLVSAAFGSDVPRWRVRRIRAAWSSCGGGADASPAVNESSTVEDVDRVAMPTADGSAKIATYLLDLDSVTTVTG